MRIITIIQTLQTLVRTMTYGQCADCVQETSIIPLSSVTALVSPQPRWAQLRCSSFISQLGSPRSSGDWHHRLWDLLFLHLVAFLKLKSADNLAFSLSNTVTRISNIGILSLCSTVINSLHSFHLALKILQIKCELKDNIVVIKCFRILFMGN